MFAINQWYKNQDGIKVQITGLQDIKPQDPLLDHGIMPIIEFIDEHTMNWHVMSLEDFERAFEEVE